MHVLRIKRVKQAVGREVVAINLQAGIDGDAACEEARKVVEADGYAGSKLLQPLIIILASFVCQ
jgi:hypothetical protein